MVFIFLVGNLYFSSLPVETCENEDSYVLSRAVTQVTRIV